VANGVVYVGSQDGNLYAFNAATGQTLWSAATSGPIYSSPTVANGVVYIGSSPIYLLNFYAFNAATGQPLWTAGVGAWVSCSAAVANGMVYVAEFNGALYAFGLPPASPTARPDPASLQFDLTLLLQH
jgi:outer membrane protein assembly factor BamB